MATYPSLEGRAVLVSGGGGGIGAAIVEAFAAQRARVALVDRDAAAAEELCRQVEARTGVRPSPAVVDLADIDGALREVRRLAAEFGPFTVLINNAGNDEAHAFGTVTSAYFDDRIAVNLRHQFFLAQELAPAMAAAGGGSIVNLGSISWMVGAPGVPVYAAAKAAVEGLTRSLARELGPRRIRVNSIAPGWVLTERQLAKGARDPKKFADYLERQCIKEHLAPVDVAELALWLAADESRRCTGHTWFVDAGAS
ncbi:SDR family NAD(P)-dependent oxidoreductase [Sphingomonas lenta]|uniref:SDR family NAD(P)-dependent oxidoreductase n=1 Tax=Sphingomonas lenta TaxID=1141887 RepID=UPI001FE6FB74|nr:SDR family oxidoreductase [Sphingomonas lenta]